MIGGENVPRKIKTKDIVDTIAALCKKACLDIRPDVKRAFEAALKREKTAVGRSIIRKLLENAALAKKTRVAICQDTGMTVLFVKVGQDVSFDGSLEKAINDGVKKGYKEGYLRKSVVRDPILRGNTGTNTPANIHYDVVPGERFEVTVFPKGFGSENKSALAMLNPTAPFEKIVDAIVKPILSAGPNACPPFFIGVGIGGTADLAAVLAKKALAEPLAKKTKEKHLARLEREVMKKANASDIGPMGFGGTQTVLSVKVKAYPTHIAGMPVAVNIYCHALRSAKAKL